MRRDIVNDGVINQAIMTYRMNQSDRVIYSPDWVLSYLHKQILNSELMNLWIPEYVLNTPLFLSRSLAREEFTSKNVGLFFQNLHRASYLRSF